MTNMIGKQRTAAGAALILGALLAVPAHAQVNTGEFSAGGLDLFWSALDGQVANPAGGSPAWVIAPGNQHPNWVEPPSNSRWITRHQGWEFDAPDDIRTTYYTSFTVANPEVFSLSGTWSSDNDSAMLINGMQVNTLGFNAFSSLTPFSINSGFVAGENTLAVQVRNGSGGANPSGVLVADLESNVVPEPGALVLLATGLVGLGWVGRRRTRQIDD